MFRDMRRKKQLLSKDESEEILRRGTSGVLALAGDEGFPYAVPLSYVYEREKIYFHSAVSGHKIDAVRKSEKASFCVIGQDHVLPEKFTTRYKSVIAFGTVRILEDGQEIRRAMERLSDKYSPGDREARDREIEKDWERLCMIEFSVTYLTGKQGIEYINNPVD